MAKLELWGLTIAVGLVNGVPHKRPTGVTTWKNDADACYVVNDVATGWGQRHRCIINLLLLSLFTHRCYSFREPGTFLRPIHRVNVSIDVY